MKKSVVVSFGSNSIMQLDEKPGTLFWSCPLHVDADGHPQAYHPNGSPPGLDFLANAGKPGNWWGVACDNKGNPFKQGVSDPAPGFYVSTTALLDSAKKASDPARYVHSGEMPFIVLPSKPTFSPHQQLGDLAMCFNVENGKSSWAVYADIGPTNQLGEGSMALNTALGLSSSPKSGGTSKEIIVMVYWPGSRPGRWPQPANEMAAKAAELFSAWGGLDTLAAAMTQYNWSAFFPPPPQPPEPKGELT